MTMEFLYRNTRQGEPGKGVGAVTVKDHPAQVVRLPGPGGDDGRPILRDGVSKLTPVARRAQGPVGRGRTPAPAGLSRPDDARSRAAVGGADPDQAGGQLEAKRRRSRRRIARGAGVGDEVAEGAERERPRSGP